MSENPKMPMTLEELDGDGLSLTGERLFGMTVRAYVAESEFGGGHFATHWSTLPVHRNPVRLFTETDVASIVEENRRLREALQKAISTLDSYADPTGYTDGYGELLPADAVQHEGLLAKETADFCRAALSQGTQP
ncbi:hypothetical protein AB3480_00680 [Rhizobium mongolense]|uniref:hypothetical protein n=1 Tax=Rhizobium mongolense TaxID=57676 RepID=UPI0034A2EA7C